MKQNHFLLIFLLVSCSYACSTTKSVQEPYALQQTYLSEPDNNTITESLFKDEDATLSEEAIQRLLDGVIRLPDTLRIAIFRYGSSSTRNHYSGYWYNEAYLKLQQSYVDLLKEKLLASNKVKKVILMPKMVIPSNPTLTQLREASVRLQADALLIFNLQSDIYYKYKFLKKDEVKAFANAEALFMDIRTGMIPFSSVATKDHLLTKGTEDFNVEESRKRAEEVASQKVLNAIADDLSLFLE